MLAASLEDSAPDGRRAFADFEASQRIGKDPWWMRAPEAHSSATGPFSPVPMLPTRSEIGPRRGRGRTDFFLSRFDVLGTTSGHR